MHFVESNCAIRIRNVTKTFQLNGKRSSAFSTIKKSISSGESRGGSEELFALKDIDIELKRGEKVGLIGENGAGKTTLLKIIAGLSRPTSGVVEVEGEITFLAGLGIGMIEDLSVRTNIILYGMIYGLKRAAITKKIPEILEWAELSRFAETPVVNLSSGMKSRLAFSITRYFEKDIYLLDEALTAGDRNFREKARAVFEEYKKTEKTFLIATHDVEFVRTFSTRAIWIHKGQIRGDGDPQQVVEEYLQIRSK